MAAELQSLLDKIQSEGVAKAEAEAATILGDAKKKAAAMIADAEKKAADFMAKAESDAALFQQRAEQSVTQSARDVVLGVKASVDATLNRVFLAKITEAMSAEFLRPILADVIKAYAKSGDDADMAVLVSAAQVDKIKDFLLKSVADAAAQGITITADNDISAGFRLSVENGRVEHDFTAQAVQTAMARVLRPALAKLVVG